MALKRFRLSASVSSDNLSAIKSSLAVILKNKGTVIQTNQGFEVDAELEGESAVVLNRVFLSELRRAEKKTRIRTEWTSGDTTEKFFDYVSKGIHKVNEK